jgi:hypothetical protein
MADPIKRFEKAVGGGALDYPFDWAEWLSDGETISSVTYVVKGGDGLLNIVEEEFDATTSTVWVDGGTAGKTYTIQGIIGTNSVPQSRGPTRSFLITVLEDVYYREAVA